MRVFPAPELLVWAGWPKMLPLCAKIAVLPFYLLEGFQMKVFLAPEIASSSEVRRGTQVARIRLCWCISCASSRRNKNGSWSRRRGKSRRTRSRMGVGVGGGEAARVMVRVSTADSAALHNTA